MSNNLVTVPSYDTFGMRGPNLPKFAKLSKMNVHTLLEIFNEF